VLTIGGLGLRDIGTLTDISGALASVHDPDALASAVPGLVVQLVPGMRSVWNEIDLAQGRNDIVSSTPIELWPGSGADLVRNLVQHPVFRHYRQTGDGQPHAISELVSATEFRRTDLYHEVYRRIGLEDQIATTVFHGDRLVELTVDRDRWGFSERDRLVLSVLRPLLVTKYAALRNQARLVRLLEAREAAAAPVTEGVLVVAPPDQIVDASPAALAIVRRWYPRSAAELPPPVADWYAARNAAGTAEPTLVVEHPVRGRLVARLLDGRSDVIVLRERTVRAVVGIGDRWELSPREAEVVELAVAGTPNAEIAGKLGISCRTVEKHLEHAYERLGVSNRGAAAALVGGFDVV
jgi:DNA-binding CsgD family transcriptional regulator